MIPMRMRDENLTVDALALLAHQPIAQIFDAAAAVKNE